MVHMALQLLRRVRTWLMGIVDPTAINLAVPDYSIDQIIGVFTNTISLGAPSASPGFIKVTDQSPHGFGDSCYFQGIFTTDGGTTWNDFGSQTPNLAAPNPQFQTVDVEAMVDATNINVYLTNFYDIAHSSSTAYTVTYKLYALAKNKMAVPLKPLPTNYVLPYDTAFNFQKVFKSGTVSFVGTAGGITTATVVHSLGYYPKIRPFYSPTATPQQVFALNQITIPPITSPMIEVRIDTNAVTFYTDQTDPFIGTSFSGSIDYRIYLDA